MRDLTKAVSKKEEEEEKQIKFVCSLKTYNLINQIVCDYINVCINDVQAVSEHHWIRPFKKNKNNNYRQTNTKSKQRVISSVDPIWKSTTLLSAGSYSHAKFRLTNITLLGVTLKPVIQSVQDLTYVLSVSVDSIVSC